MYSVFRIVFIKFESILYCIEYFSMYSTPSLQANIIELVQCIYLCHLTHHVDSGKYNMLLNLQISE